jgi:hypothetical protein
VEEDGGSGRRSWALLSTYPKYQFEGRHHKEYLTDVFAADDVRPRGPKRKVNALEEGSRSGSGTPPLSDEADGLAPLFGVPHTQAEAETSSGTGTPPLNDDADGLAPQSPTQT